MNGAPNTTIGNYCFTAFLIRMVLAGLGRVGVLNSIYILTGFYRCEGYVFLGSLVWDTYILKPDFGLE